MARVTYGALITELAGSIGGISFQKNSSGNIARLKPNMTMLPSPAQFVQQNALSQMIAIWPTLTDVQKTSWDNLAAGHSHINPWGQIKILNGFQWFMSCNLNRASAGAAIILTAPAWSVIAAPDAFTLVPSAGDFYADFGSIKNFAGYYLFVFITTPLRQSSMKLRRANFLLRVDTDPNSRYVALKVDYAAFLNVTWATFYNNSDCSIIVRLLKVEKSSGLASPYTSALIKI